MLSSRLQILLIPMIFSASEAQVSFDSSLSNGLTIVVAENATIGSTIYHLQANDPQGNTPYFTAISSTCESFQQTNVTSFPITDLDDLVVPDGGLDAENCSQFRFTFRVTAGGSTATSGPLTINVTDVNDIPPKFNKKQPYIGKVWKSDKTGQIVNEDDAIQAEDNDISKLQVSLSILGAQTTFAIYQNGSVYVDGSSGLASLASPTVLTIQASDGGLTSTATLSIEVYDDLCSSSPCQNGGTCNSSRNNYTCDCLSGYDGVRCERVDYCHMKPCQHGNSCFNSDNTYSCICTCPYANNSTDNKNCTEDNRYFPCLNGGLCKIGTVSDCLCVNNYTGTFCEIPPTITTTTITTTTITETRTTNTTTTTSQTTPLTTTPNGNVTKDKETNNKNKTNDWATIGSVITGVSASIIVFFAVAFACKKKNDTNPDLSKPDAFELKSSQPTETYAT